MKLETIRQAAFNALFQLDMNNDLNIQLAIEMATPEFETRQRRDIRKIEEKVQGTRDNLTQIDEIIDDNLDYWKLARVATAERNILRLAVYEMFFAEKKIDTPIIINEAVNLAKKFGSDDNAGKFVNGVLNAVAEDLAE